MQLQAFTNSRRINDVIINTSSIVGRGATAIVYKARYDNDNEDHLAAKIYSSPTKFNANKILAMLQSLPQEVYFKPGTNKNHIQLAWPVALLKDNQNRNVGYLMKLFDKKKSFPLDYYYDGILFEKMNAPSEAALSFKIEIAKNLTYLIHELHSLGHHFIDLKPQNILIAKDTHFVSALDCDGFSITSKSGGKFSAELVSTDYISPEATKNKLLPKDLDEKQDRYALAVVLFQLLNNGTHPFQGILKDKNANSSTNDQNASEKLYPYGLDPITEILPRPQSLHQCWPRELRELFDKAFLGSPSQRPSAIIWWKYFKSVLANKELARCNEKPNDIAHMRFKGKACPACYLTNLKVTPPAKSRKTTNKTNKSYVTPSVSKKIEDNNAWWWVIGFIIFLVLYNLASDDNSKSSSTSSYSTSQSQSYSPPAEPAYTVPAEPAYTPPSEPEFGYISLAVGTESDYWTFALHYSTQQEAHNKVRDTCRSRSEGKCQIIDLGNKHKCLAFAQGITGVRAYGLSKDSLEEAEQDAINKCNQKGDFCTIPENASSC